MQIRQQEGEEMAPHINGALVSHFLIQTGRGVRRPSTGTILIARSIHLKTEVFELFTLPYQRKQIIEIARTLAVLIRHPNLMAIGRSAALLRGLSLPQPLDGSTPAIELADLHKHKRRAQVLPAVIFEGQVISESTRALVRSGAFTSTQAEQRGSFWVQQPIDMIISAACIDGKEQAFVLVCTGLRHLLRIGRYDHATKEATEQTRRRLLQRLETERDSGTKIRRARWILQNANPGCESPGEALMLYQLLSAGIGGWETQYHVTINELHYFLDLALPDLMIAFEFDGRAKYGNTLEEVHRSEEEERRRQRVLESLGWTIIRVRWTDLYHPEQYIGEFKERCARHGYKLPYCAPPRRSH